VSSETTLDRFIADARKQLDAFEVDWRKNNAATPDKYPMSFSEDNAGLWWEMLTEFADSKDQ
jgi:hypothetical protein